MLASATRSRGASGEREGRASSCEALVAQATRNLRTSASTVHGRRPKHPREHQSTGPRRAKSAASDAVRQASQAAASRGRAGAPADES